MSKSVVETGIHDFKFVDKEAYPINLEEIKNAIGYPIEALKAEIQGKVMCRILVDEYGRYKKHKITQHGHPLLSSAVEPYLSNLNFSPAKLEGETTDYWLNLLFEFDLRSNPFKGLNRLSSRHTIRKPFSSNFRKAEKCFSKAKSYYTAQNYIQARRMAWSSIHLNPFRRRKSHVSKELLMRAWTLYGKSEAKLNNSSSAVRAFTEAIAIGEEICTQLTHNQSNLTNLYLYRSQSRMNTGQQELAMNDLHWVLNSSQNPHIQSKAMLVRSYISAQLNAYDQALNDAETALELNPYYFQAAWQKAELLSKIGAKEEACNILHAYPPVYEAIETRWKTIVEESCLTDAAKN